MNRRRRFLLFALTLGLGCGFDSVVSPDTGSIVIRIVWGSVEPSHARSVPASSADATPGNTVDTLDAARIHVIGPTTKTVQLTDAGDHFAGVVDNLSPGAYTVAAEGLMSGEVTYYGQVQQVQVVAGSSTGAEIPIVSFQPRILELDSATTALRFAVSFSSVQHADAYLVEIATDSEFLNSSTHAAADTSVVVAATGLGSHFIRVRAENSIISAPGRASEPRRVEIVTDVAATGDDPGTAPLLGFGSDVNQTIVDVNILPLGDADWFAVDVCALDTLIVETFAQRLSVASELNTYLRVYESTGTVLAAENNDIASSSNLDSRIESTISDDGRYFIVVTGFQDGSVGAYELSIAVIPGPRNLGSSCMLSGAPTGR